MCLRSAHGNGGLRYHSRGRGSGGGRQARPCSWEYLRTVSPCTQPRVTSSSPTRSGALRPAASAAKLITSRWVSTVGATARRSSSSGIGRPSSAARALAPRIKYWDARGPAPHDTNSLMNAGTSASPPPGRVIRTSVTAERTNGFGTGMRRTRCCRVNTSSAVNTGAISVARSPVVASTIVSSYPTKEEEETIVEATTGDRATEIAPVLTAEDGLTLQPLARRIPVPKPLVRAAVTLVRMSRPGDAEAPAFVKEFVSWGAGPRASQYLILGAKARAALDGRPMPDEDDLRAVAPTVLTHRLVINFAAEAAGRSAPDLVGGLLVARGWVQGETVRGDSP